MIGTNLKIAEQICRVICNGTSVSDTGNKMSSFSPILMCYNWKSLVRWNEREITVVNRCAFELSALRFQFKMSNVIWNIVCNCQLTSRFFFEIYFQKISHLLWSIARRYYSSKIPFQKIPSSLKIISKNLRS